MSIPDFAFMMSVLFCIAGTALIMFAALRLIHRNSCQEVDGTIVNYTQEYSTRGFIRKMQVAYEFNGREYTYITSGRTFRRHTGETIKLKINNKGKVVEIGQNVELMIAGALMLTIAIVLFVVL